MSVECLFSIEPPCREGAHVELAAAGAAEDQRCRAGHARSRRDVITRTRTIDSRAVDSRSVACSAGGSGVCVISQGVAAQAEFESKV
jgi:hypothetical protein